MSDYDDFDDYDEYDDDDMYQDDMDDDPLYDDEDDAPYMEVNEDYEDDDRVDESDWHNIFIEDLGWLDVRDPQVYEHVSRLYVIRHAITHFWAWKIVGPFFRFRHNILRPFKRCVNCGKRGIGPYWFSDTCSDECSKAQYAKRVADSKKWHLRKDEHYTLCGEWIWLQIKVGILTSDVNTDEFCSRCLSKAGVR